MGRMIKKGLVVKKDLFMIHPESPAVQPLGRLRGATKAPAEAASHSSTIWFIIEAGRKKKMG